MKFTLLLILFVIKLTEIRAQSSSVFELMREDSITDIYLRLNWKELAKKKTEKVYMPASLAFRTSKKDTIIMQAEVRARGNMRLNICTYPPVKIKFNKAQLASDSLKPLNEIDLVHHCHPGELYEQYILREFLAYKLYQQLSPYSYNVKLVRIHYLNSDGSESQQSCLGYVVENSEELADRLQAKRNKTATMTYNALDKTSTLRVCLFEFMIGNTDWAVKNRHNLEFIGVDGIPFLVPVPFDFDYSGLVSAPYSKHHESIDLPFVTDRFYQGKCESKEEVTNMINEFISKKEILLQLPLTIPGLDDRSRKHTIEYLNEFFTIIENPKKVEALILKHCDKWPSEN